MRIAWHSGRLQTSEAQGSWRSLAALTWLAVRMQWQRRRSLQCVGPVLRTQAPSHVNPWASRLPQPCVPGYPHSIRRPPAGGLPATELHLLTDLQISISTKNEEAYAALMALTASAPDDVSSALQAAAPVTNTNGQSFGMCTASVVFNVSRGVDPAPSPPPPTIPPPPPYSKALGTLVRGVIERATLQSVPSVLN